MSSFHPAKRPPATEDEIKDVSRLFGDLVAKLDATEVPERKTQKDNKKDEAPGRYFGFQGFLPR